MADDSVELSEVERLAADFSEALQAGERPSIDDLVAGNPSCASELRELLLTIQAMDSLKDRRDSRHPSKADQIGSIRRLGDFRIIREIGHGGMGVVYEAIQESLGRTVAVKVLPKQRIGDAHSLARFQQEAKTAASLHHTNIVPVLGVGEDDGHHYYVMQYIRGVGLDEVIGQLRNAITSGHQETLRRWTPAAMVKSLLDPKDGVRSQTSTVDEPDHAAENEVGDAADAPEVWRQTSHQGGYWRSVAGLLYRVAEAIQYAHEKEILHRDIKPSNLLVDIHGDVSVADFGLAKMTDQAGISRTGDVVGTLRYMAPEQFSEGASRQSDVYALGVTLYELSTLRPAFDDGQLARTLALGKPMQADRPRDLRPEMPLDLETIILKAMNSEPSLRYPSAADLASDLDRFCEDRPILARRSSSLEHLWRWSRRNPALACVCSIAFALLVAVAVVSTTAYYRTNLARQDAIQQRNKADRTAEAAFEALEEVFNSLAPMPLVPPDRFADSTGLASGEASNYKPTRQDAALLENLLGFYEQIAEAGQTEPQYRDRLAEAHKRIGDIQRRLGQIEGAVDAYRRAASLYAGLARRDSSLEFLVRLAAVHNAIGTCLDQARREQKPLPTAGKKDRHAGSEEFTTALRLLEPVEAADSPPSLLYELAHTYFLLGDVPREPRRFDSAFVSEAASNNEGSRKKAESGTLMLERASTILEELVASYPKTPDYRQLQALCYLERSKGFLTGSTESERLRLSAVDVLAVLVSRFPGNPDYRFALTIAHASGRVNDARMNRDSIQAYLVRLTMAEAMLADLRVEYPESLQYFVAHLKLFRQLGALHRRQQGAGADLEIYRTAAKVCREARPEVVNNISFKAVIETYLRAAELLLAKDSKNPSQDLEEAAAIFKAGIEEFDRMERRTDESSDLRIREQFESRLEEIQEKLAELKRVQ